MAAWSLDLEGLSRPYIIRHRQPEKLVMTASFTLGDHFESFIQAQVDTGRYESASEVVRDALRLLEERERKLAELDAALAIGLADVEAGRVRDADEVFDELDAEIERIAAKRKTA